MSDQVIAYVGKCNPLSAAALEKMKQQWELAADSMPKLICLLDREGRAIRVNRTLERWNLGAVTAARGLSLHEMLHGNCADAGCRLATFCRAAITELLGARRVKHEGWDAKLQRYLSIVIHPPVGGARAELQRDELLAVAEVEDMSEIQAKEDRRAKQALRDTQSELQRLSAQHVTIRETERRRVAMDLHDGLGQSLNLLKLSIQETARGMEAENSVDALNPLVRAVEIIVDEVRRIAMDLRPSMLDDLGLIPTLSWFFREFQAKCRAMRIEPEIEVSDADVPEPLKITIYRILQEAMCNALRHADADAVRVRLYKDGEGLRLSIADDGRGFDWHAKRGLGLQSMKERAELRGGHFAIESTPGKGTCIDVGWAGARLRSMTGKARIGSSASVNAADFGDRAL